MGPVSFELVVADLDRAEAIRLAQALTEAGLRPSLALADSAIIVRSDEAPRARTVIESLRSTEADR